MRSQPDEPTLSVDEVIEILEDINAENPPLFVRDPEGRLLRIIAIEETARAHDPVLLTDTIDPEREGM